MGGGQTPGQSARKQKRSLCDPGSRQDRWMTDSRLWRGLQLDFLPSALLGLILETACVPERPLPGEGWRWPREKGCRSRPEAAGVCGTRCQPITAL